MCGRAAALKILENRFGSSHYACNTRHRFPFCKGSVSCESGCAEIFLGPASDHSC